MVFILVTVSCAFASLGSFLFGYDSGIISSSIAQTSFKGKFGSSLNDDTTGGIVSAYTGAYTYPSHERISSISIFQRQYVF
jgi:hypothetical protein